MLIRAETLDALQVMSWTFELATSVNAPTLGSCVMTFGEGLGEDITNTMGTD